MMMNLVILYSLCLKDNKWSLQKRKKKIEILSVFYLSMFRLEHHCYINKKKHKNKNWT